MKKRSLFMMALFCICLFQIIEINAQDISYVKNRKVDNTFNRLHQSKKYFFEQPNVLMKKNNQSSILTNSLMVLQPIIPDFQVNDDTGSTDQKFPAIAIDCSGNFMIIWTDKRNGHYTISS